MTKLAMSLLLAELFGASPAPAQTESRLDARIAQAIVDGCAAHAGAKMQSHAIAVVDTGGHLVAALCVFAAPLSAQDRGPETLTPDVIQASIDNLGSVSATATGSGGTAGG